MIRLWEVSLHLCPYFAPPVRDIGVGRCMPLKPLLYGSSLGQFHCKLFFNQFFPPHFSSLADGFSTPSSSHCFHWVIFLQINSFLHCSEHIYVTIGAVRKQWHPSTKIGAPFWKSCRTTNNTPTPQIVVTPLTAHCTVVFGVEHNMDWHTAPPKGWLSQLNCTHSKFVSFTCDV